jgi:hypothetical protein
MPHPAGDPPADNPVLRYMAILTAARDFGLGRAQIERIALQFDPLAADARELADALADALLEGSAQA